MDEPPTPIPNQRSRHVDRRPRKSPDRIAAQRAKEPQQGKPPLAPSSAVLAVVLVIVGIIGFVVVSGSKNNKIAESGLVPASANEYGGIVLTKDGIVKNSSTQETRDFKQLATSTSSVTPMVNGTAAAVNTLPRACRRLKAARTASPYA